MKCSFCDNQAIISQKYSGLHLCQDHFIQDFDRRVA